MQKVSAPLQKDAYKVFHKFAYNPKVTHVYANFTPRFNKHSNTGMDKMVWAGLQVFLVDYLLKSWGEFFLSDKEEVVGEYEKVVSSMLGKPINADHLRELHDLGYLPIRVKALPEGVLVPYGTPCVTVENTVSGFGWLTNMIETVMSSYIWPVCTSATTAYAYRKAFEDVAEETGLPKDLIPFLGHDFSYRGMMGTEAAMLSGIGHLFNFTGSDTIPAAMALQEYYFASFDQELVIASVDATEHSVMCSYEQDGEKESLVHLMENVSPTGILSVVSDTWDFWKLVTEYLPKLKKKIMKRDGKLVIRPDSGDPVDILCGTYSKFETFDGEFYMESIKNYMEHKFESELVSDNPHFSDTQCFNTPDGPIEVTYTPCLDRHDKTYYYVDNYLEDYDSLFSVRKLDVTPESKGLIECLWDTFGGEVNEQGYKMLDEHVGAIYGDSITLERQRQIISRLMDKGFCPAVVLGIGSYTYQYVTRDTHGSAVKATCTQHGEGNLHPISKDPKTDSSKKSAKGLLRVDLVDGEYVTSHNVSREKEKGGELKRVFENGVIISTSTLQEVRERLWG